MNNQEQPRTDPQSIIQAIRQEISVMGANDSEFSQLDKIIKDLNSGLIKADEAVNKAQAIRDGKQDYH